jgi:hypothetical protein
LHVISLGTCWESVRLSENVILSGYFVSVYGKSDIAI